MIISINDGKALPVETALGSDLSSVIYKCCDFGQIDLISFAHL